MELQCPRRDFPRVHNVCEYSPQREFWKENENTEDNRGPGMLDMVPHLESDSSPMSHLEVILDRHSCFLRAQLLLLPSERSN